MDARASDEPDDWEDRWSLTEPFEVDVWVNDWVKEEGCIGTFLKDESPMSAPLREAVPCGSRISDETAIYIEADFNKPAAAASPLLTAPSMVAG
jgi:hypothetical protein